MFDFAWFFYILQIRSRIIKVEGQSCDKVDHDYQCQVKYHSDDECPGDEKNFLAVAKHDERRRVGLRPAFGSYQTHSDAQAQRCTDRRSTHFDEEGLVTFLAEYPGVAGFGNAFWFHQVHSIVADAIGTN